MPTAPITDSQWKEHQVIKQVANADDMNNYASELATEMRIYSLNRLENVRDNVDAIIKRLREVKPKKPRGKSKRRQAVRNQEEVEQARGPNSDLGEKLEAETSKIAAANQLNESDAKSA